MILLVRSLFSSLLNIDSLTSPAPHMCSGIGTLTAPIFHCRRRSDRNNLFQHYISQTLSVSNFTSLFSGELSRKTSQRIKPTPAFQFLVSDTDFQRVFQLSSLVFTTLLQEATSRFHILWRPIIGTRHNSMVKKATENFGNQFAEIQQNDQENVHHYEYKVHSFYFSLVYLV